MLPPKFPRSLRPSFRSSSAITPTTRLLWAFAALAPLGLIQGARGAINTFQQNASFGTPGNWSGGVAPTAAASAGSYQDLLLASGTTALTTTSAHIYGQSLNVTNGSSYTVTGNTGSSTIRVGATGSGSEVLATFTNGVSSVGNDLVYLSNSSNLTLSAGTATPVFNLRQAGNFNISAGSTFTSNLVITQLTTLSSGVNINGNGLTIFNAANTYNGLTTINGGTLRYGINDALATGGITVAGGTLDLQSFNDTVGAVTLTSGSIVGGGTLTGASYTLTSGTIDARLGGSATVAIGAGSVNLNGANSHTGSTTVASGGTLKLGNASALGTTALGTSVSSGGALDLNGQSIGAEALTLTGSGIGSTGAMVNTSATAASFAGPVTLAGNTTIGLGAGGIALTGNIGESGGVRGITLVGSGNLTLSGTNNYAGVTFANYTGGGTLIAATPGSLSPNSQYRTASSSADAGLLKLGAAGDYQVASLSLGSVLNVVAPDSGAATLTIPGGGFQTGTSSKVVETEANAAVILGTTVGASTFDLIGSSATADRGVTFRGAGNITVNSILQDNASGSASSFKGGVTKSGSGTLTLHAANTYSGPTVITNGTLVVGSTGSINGTSGLTVASGATFIYNSTTAYSGGAIDNNGTLSGAGALNVAVTLDSLTDILAPGNSPGIQTFGAPQSWASFTYNWELNDWSASVAGTNFDQIAIDGALELTGTAPDVYELNVLSLLGDNTGGAVSNFAESSISRTILSASGGITGFLPGTWKIDVSGFANAEQGMFSLSVNGNNLDLTYTPIPEPSGFAVMVGAGMIGFALHRRRRQKAKLAA